MLRSLFVLAMIIKVFKELRAYIKSRQRHVGSTPKKVMWGDSVVLEDSCTVS